MSTPTCTVETMTVTINDRAADARNWGNGSHTPALRTVTIPKACPKCGAERGDVRSRRFVEDGDWYSADVWSNACGHVDMYPSVLAEAERFAAVPA